MNQEREDMPKKQTSDGFDRIVQLISECVVIKARMQQLMDSLNNDEQNLKAIFAGIHSMTVSSAHELNAIKQSGEGAVTKALAEQRKQSTALEELVRKCTFPTHIVALDETVGRFGKVLGDLQTQLMKMDLGSSAISIMQVLLVTRAQEVFAFSLEHVCEILKVKNEERYSVDGNETISLRGHALPIIDMCTVFGTTGETTEKGGEKKIVVVADGDMKVGIVVDELLGEESIVYKNLPRQIEGVPGIHGASILGDGHIGLIVDVKQVITMVSNT